jgi:hypothetical protein
MRARTLLVLSVVTSLVVACRDEDQDIAPEPAAPAPAPAPISRPERPEPEHSLGMVTTSPRVRFPNARGECEPGETKTCGIIPAPGPTGSRTLRMRCVLGGDGVMHFNKSECATPLVVAFDDAPVAFTNAAGTFTLGPFERTEWVSSRTPWLALDLDGSGCIEAERELFRFDRLAPLDDNHDGVIDAGDAAYQRLVLWFDRDQDRRCAPAELVGLAEAGIVALDLHVTPEGDTVLGSHEGERSSVTFRRGNELRRGQLIDVYLAPQL